MYIKIQSRWRFNPCNYCVTKFCEKPENEAKSCPQEIVEILNCIELYFMDERCNVFFIAEQLKMDYKELELRIGKYFFIPPLLLIEILRLENILHFLKVGMPNDIICIESGYKIRTLQKAFKKRFRHNMDYYRKLFDEKSEWEDKEKLYNEILKKFRV